MKLFWNVKTFGRFIFLFRFLVHFLSNDAKYFEEKKNLTFERFFSISKNYHKSNSEPRHDILPTKFFPYIEKNAYKLKIAWEKISVNLQV